MQEATLFPEWKYAARIAGEEFQHGDLITFEWLYEKFKIRPPEHGSLNDYKSFQLKFLSMTENFKTLMLEDHFMMLQATRQQSYLIVMPNEQSDLCWHNMRKRIGKELNRANDALMNIKLDMLSVEARTSNTTKLASLACLKSMTRREFKNERHNVLQSGKEDNVQDPGTGNGDSGQTQEETKQE